MKYVLLLIIAASAVSVAMSVLTIWILRVFGMDIDYSWQSIAAIWITMAVVSGIATRVKEY